MMFGISRQDRYHSDQPECKHDDIGDIVNRMLSMNYYIGGSELTYRLFRKDAGQYHTICMGTYDIIVDYINRTYNCSFYKSDSKDYKTLMKIIKQKLVEEKKQKEESLKKQNELALQRKTAPQRAAKLDAIKKIKKYYKVYGY